MSDDDIYHFGVKGMKWGVIRKKVTKKRAVGALVGGVVANQVTSRIAAQVFKVAGVSPLAAIYAGSAMGTGMSVAGMYAGVKIADMHGGKPKNERR